MVAEDVQSRVFRDPEHLLPSPAPCWGVWDKQHPGTLHTLEYTLITGTCWHHNSSLRNKKEPKNETYTVYVYTAHTHTCRYVKENLRPASFMNSPRKSSARRLCIWLAVQLESMVMRAVIPTAAGDDCPLMWGTVRLKEQAGILSSFVCSYRITHAPQESL